MSATSDYNSIEQAPDNIIQSYNDMWLDHKKAWISQDRSTAGQSRFTVLSTLRTWPHVTPPSETYVYQVYKQALAFLSYYASYLEPVHISSHWTFLQRMERSFDRAKCEHEIDTKHLRNSIFAIRQRCLGSYQEGHLSFAALQKEYQARIPYKELPYSNEELPLCDLMIFADSDKTPIPVIRAQLFKRNDAWKQLISPILEQKTALNPELHFHHHSKEAVLQLIHIIHSALAEAYPKEIPALIALGDLAQELQEDDIFDHCLAKAEEVITEQSPDAINTLCQKFKGERIPDQFQRFLGSKRAEVLWKKEPAALSQDEVLCLLHQERAPIPEIKVLESLEKWEEAQLDNQTGAKGDLIAKKKLADGKYMIDHIRFEHIDLDQYITEVMTRDYIPLKARLFYLKAVQSHNTPGSTIKMGDWKPRMDRYKHVLVERDYQGDSDRVKVTAHIAVSPASRFPTGKVRHGVTKSANFTLFGKEAHFEISEKVKDYENYLGVFLKIKGLSKKHPLTLKHRSTTSGNGKESKSSGTHTWDGHTSWGTILKDPTLAQLVENGYVTMTADISKVEISEDKAENPDD